MHGKSTPTPAPTTPATPTTPSSTSSSSSSTSKDRRKKREESTATPTHLAPTTPTHTSMSPAPSSSSQASLQAELRVKDGRIRDCEQTIQTLREAAREYEKKVRELERAVTNLKDAAKDKEKEAAQFEAKHRKESDKVADQSKGEIRTLTNKLAAMEQELQKTQSARLQAQREATEARELAEKHKKGAESEIAKVKAELREGDKTRLVSLEKEISEMKKEHVGLQVAYKEEQALRKKYWNVMEDMKGKIRVYCRTRPAVKGDGQSVVDTPDMYSCLLKHPRSGEHSFLFDCVYGPDATQETVFDDVKNMVQSAIDGFNVCIFAYGQTGSGKTHTMVGDSAHQGIVPRALRHLFSLLHTSAKSTPGFTSNVGCYMLELYNEQLLDMLVDEKNRGEVKIKKDANGVVYAHNAHTVKLHSAGEAETLLQKGFNSRRTEATNMNERSSRSHLIITLTVESKDPGTHATTHGKISFIDLAGSERVSKSGVSADRLKEAQAINLSLSALGDVISALSKGESFVPYRNHKLTLLMSDSLGGNAKTLMIVCVSPSVSNVEESFSSLAFATRAKTITNNPVKAVESQEVSRLKRIISDMKKGDKGHMAEELLVLSPSDDSRDKDAEIARLRRQIDELQHALQRATQLSPRKSPRSQSTTPRSARTSIPESAPSAKTQEPAKSNQKEENTTPRTNITPRINGFTHSPESSPVVNPTPAAAAVVPPAVTRTNAPASSVKAAPTLTVRTPESPTPSPAPPSPTLTVPSFPPRPTSPLLQLPYTPVVTSPEQSSPSSPQFPSRPPPQPPTGARPAQARPPPSPKGPPPPTPPHLGKTSPATLTPKPPSPSPPASPTPSPPATPNLPTAKGTPKVPSLVLPTSTTPAKEVPAQSLTQTAPTPAKESPKKTQPAALEKEKVQPAPIPTQPTPAPVKETAPSVLSPKKTQAAPTSVEKHSPIATQPPVTAHKSPSDKSLAIEEKKSPKTEEVRADKKKTTTPREKEKTPRDAEAPTSGKHAPPGNLASVAAAAAAAASKRVGSASPRVKDGATAQAKPELGVVLPSKPGDKLVHPKRPTMTGRKKPTKNAIQNKKEMELKSAEVKASVGASSSGTVTPKQPRISQSIGGFSLLANLVVNKPLTPTGNGASPRPGTPQELVVRGMDSAPSSPSLDSSSSNLSLDFKQLLDPGGPKLLQIKGRRRVKVHLVELSYHSLNQGDVFILDVGTKLFLWNGSRANRMEKAKGLDVCTRIKDKDRNTRATIITLDENDNNPEFWDPLGGRGPIAEESEGGDDATTDATEEDLLYKIEEQNGEYLPVVIESRRPAKEMLESSHCFILDSFSEMYVWIGRGCTTGSKNASSHIAKELFLSKSDRPAWTRISRLTEGTESVLFKEKFSNWPDKLPIATQAAVIKGRVANINKDDKVDVKKMYDYNPPASRVVEGTDGKIQMWVISDFEKKELPQEQLGHFYSAESYIIMYTYMVKWKECYMIFFWQGRDSSINEKGTSAVLTVDLDEQCGGAAEQIRVVQNQEPEHFLKLFDGKMIIHKGRMNGGQLPATLYHVRKHAVQVVARTASLNSNDCFLLRTPTHLYVWNGQGASQDFRKAAQQIAQTSFMKGPRKIVDVTENAEPGGFWTAFPEGDPTQYAKYIFEKPPRLFHCTNASGRFTPREVFRASQDDLVQDDVMILDMYKCVYVWEGRGANEEEKRLGMELAVEYARSAPDKRPADSPIYHVKSGREPRLFIYAFHGWDSTSTILDLNESTLTPLVEDMLRQYSRTYTLDELLSKPKELDQTTLEFYLSDADFLRHFSMPKEEYRAMPIWKRDIQKKKVGLY